ncbi:hypothetical protein HQ489_02885 [Candidatus Woesearchaeota archaeon]|nr:hypothetical protein [Candidatus Woesearchaeota archaeon]
MGIFNNNFYGVDVAIENHTGVPLCYEINGIHSGMKGFKLLGTYDNLIETLVDKLIVASEGKPIVLMNRPLADVRRKNIKSKLEKKGVETIGCSSMRLRDPKVVREDNHGIIFGTGLDQLIYHGHHTTITNPLFLECFSSAKILQQLLLTGTDITTNIPTTAYIGNNHEVLDKFLVEMEEKGVNKFLYKPNIGAQGNGVIILDKDKVKLINNKIMKKSFRTIMTSINNYFLAAHDPSFFGEDAQKSVGLFQEFRQSKPILSSETGQYHSACGRIIHFNGSLDGYWRLSPVAVNDVTTSEEDRHVVNLARKSLVEPMSDSDKEILFPFADHLIQTYEHELKPFAFKHPGDFADYKSKIYNALFEGKDIGDLTTFYNLHHRNIISTKPQNLFGII